MNNKKSQFNFLLVAIAGMSILIFFIFRPFLAAIILGVIFASAFYPIYSRISVKLPKYPGITSVIATLVFIIFILTPIFFIGWQVFSATNNLYDSLTKGGEQNLIQSVNKILLSIKNKVPFAQNISLDITQYARTAASWLAQNIGSIFSNIAKIGMSTFVFLITFYYFLKDKQRFKNKLIYWSPLSDKDDEAILQKLKLSINSVIKGNFLIALLEGISTTIGLAIFGVPNYFLWGAIAGVASLIPSVGPPIVIIPAIIYLVLTKMVWQAVGLAIWGMTAVGLIDNLIGPKLMGSGIKFHPLLVILSILGGILFFGPIGFLLGPLSLSLFFAFLDIYTYLFREPETNIKKIDTPT